MAYIGTSPQNGVRNRFVYAATQGQTAFTGADADSKTLAISDQLYTDVYQNGVKLKLTTDWTATATTVTLVNAASADDVIEIVSFDVFSVSDTVPASTGGAFAGAISATSYGAVSGTTGTFSGDVGIGTTVPYTTSNLNVAGATSTSTTAFGPTDPPAAGQIDIRSTDAYSTQRGGKLTLSGNSGTSGAVALSVYGAIQGVKENSTINNAGGGLAFSTTLNANGLLTERMRIDGTGNVGIGETAPANLLHVKASDTGIAPHASAQIVLEREGTNYLQFLTAENGTSGCLFGDGSDVDVGKIVYDHNTTSMQFHTEAAERMRITSAGKMGFGTSTQILNGGGALASFTFGGAQGVFISTVSQSGGECMGFVHQGSSVVGTIAINSSSTSYNTSSDYRLKENVNYTWDATTRLKQLKPAQFNWIADDTNTLVDGFLAHEVSSVVPQAITKTKDAMTAEVLYEEGDELPDGKNIGDVKQESVPDYQGIDQSKLVPLLVKALQEQQVVIESLTTRITALEAE